MTIHFHLPAPGAICSDEICCRPGRSWRKRSGEGVGSAGRDADVAVGEAINAREHIDSVEYETDRGREQAAWQSRKSLKQQSHHQ